MTQQALQTRLRLALVQWRMRGFNGPDELMEHAGALVKAAADYNSDFVLFPELFTAPLMARTPARTPAEAMKELAATTAGFVSTFCEWAQRYKCHILCGSMPELVDGVIMNVGYLCRREGGRNRYEKLHVTPDEAAAWGIGGGSKLSTFATDRARIGVLVCYDAEFPELSRLLADEGLDILFVPFLTDSRSGYNRVRQCARARAIENECYVAIAGSVGYLTGVANLDAHYAQSAVFTPCDFAFPPDGIQAEALADSETLLIADVDTGLLPVQRRSGSVRNLADRRRDLYEVRRVKE